MKLEGSIDFHSHILPKCDDGSDCVETSRKQLDMAKAAGVSTICATPHFYPHRDSVERFLERRTQGYENLSKILLPDDPRVLLGAEVLICDGLDRMEGLCKLCLEGTDMLLLEMPFYKWGKNIIETATSLSYRDDVSVVIAHADRYPPREIEKNFIARGIPLQLNINALIYSINRYRYKKWIKNGYVKYLGSDIHKTEKAYEKWGKYVRLLESEMV